MQEYFIRPIALSDEVENNPKLNAEREIYYLLKKQIEENSNPFNCSLFYKQLCFKLNLVPVFVPLTRA